MPRRIGLPWVLIIAFVVLVVNNAWLKGIFGEGEIAVDVLFMLTELTLFVTRKFTPPAATAATL